MEIEGAKAGGWCSAQNSLPDPLCTLRALGGRYDSCLRVSIPTAVQPEPQTPAITHVVDPHPDLQTKKLKCTIFKMGK